MVAERKRLALLRRLRAYTDAPIDRRTGFNLTRCLAAMDTGIQDNELRALAALIERGLKWQ